MTTKILNLLSAVEKKRHDGQAALLAKAEAGDRVALEYLRRRGLRYWRRGERVIISTTNSNPSNPG